MKYKRLLILVIVILLIWNVVLTVTLTKYLKNNTNVTNITENNVSGFSTDLTKIVKDVKSSCVTVQTEDNILSGIVYDTKDTKTYVVTCFHGIEGQSSIKVLLDNGLLIDAKEIGHDIYCDIAVLEIETEFEIQKVDIGDNTLLKDGEFLLTVGTPTSIEYSNSTELCVVSSPLKEIRNSISYEGTTYDYYLDTIQISGDIKEGFSGAPLFNMAGEVVGVITMNKETSLFALTINEAKIVVDNIINGNEINYVDFGITGSYVKNLENYNKNFYNLPLELTHGYYVKSIRNDSILNDCGIKSGDVILSINSIEINKQTDLLKTKYSLNNTFEITVLRDNQEFNFQGTIIND